jgi:beta-glucosidase
VGGRKPLVAVLMNGRPLALSWLADSVPAIVETWFLGTEHGRATADVLFGDANPAGRLPASFPRATGQIPVYAARRSTGRPPSAADKYTSKYLDLPTTPQWPLGHGLSYTTFGYRDPALSKAELRAGDSLAVRATVTNTGPRVGDEVVQLYLRDDVASVTRPMRSLRGARRITLRPGESATVRFTLGPDDVALYDATMRRVVEPGTFTVWMGASSADARLDGRFRMTGETAVLREAPTRMR